LCGRVTRRQNRVEHRQKQIRWPLTPTPGNEIKKFKTWSKMPHHSTQLGRIRVTEHSQYSAYCVNDNDKNAEQNTFTNYINK